MSHVPKCMTSDVILYLVMSSPGQGLTNQNLIYLSGAVLLLQNTEFLLGFPIYLIHFSGQVRKYFTCPAKIFTCPGQPDNGFVRPCPMDPAW